MNLTKEFQLLPQNYRSKQDILEVRKLAVFAASVHEPRIACKTDSHDQLQKGESMKENINHCNCLVENKIEEKEPSTSLRNAHLETDVQRAFSIQTGGNSIVPKDSLQSGKGCPKTLHGEAVRDILQVGCPQNNGILAKALESISPFYNVSFRFSE